MPIDIATTLAVRDRRSDEPASLVDIAGAVGAWADYPDPERLLEPGKWTEVGYRLATIETEKFGLIR